MRIRRYPFVIAALAGVVAAGMLTARPDQSSATAVAYAATRTLDAGSSRIEVTYQFPQSAISSADLFPFAITGLIDYRNHRGQISYGSHGVEILFDGRVVYERVGPQLSVDKPWVRSEQVDAFGASDVFDLQQRAMFDPSHVLAFLRRTSSGVHEVGSDTVRGFETTHYEGVLDLQKIVDQAPTDQRHELQEELDFFTEDGPKTISYGLWAGADGTARRLRIDEGQGAAITLEFYDFGVPVVLRFPPEDQVLTPEEYWDAVQKYEQEHASDCDGDPAEASPATPAEPGTTYTIVICKGTSLGG
jgi:hypothetical protein